MTIKGLVYIGKVIVVEPIPDADYIERLDVVCGHGGKWSAVSLKGQFQEGDTCQVYLQDSLLPQTEEFAFMERHKYRVRMLRLRGVPSEVLVMPQTLPGNVGDDVTRLAGVEKYEKPIPTRISGIMAGNFPSFVPKTDEPNWQSAPEMVDALTGQQFFATVKVDGTSTTAFKKDGHFGVCSRNYELRDTDNNALWCIAKEYGLPDGLPEGVALQWETVGPGVQKNPLGLKKVEPRLFDVWFIDERRYGTWTELAALANTLDMPTVELIEHGAVFDMDAEQLRVYAEGTYPNGKQREGVVIRPIEPQWVGGDRLSFKIVNLRYKD